MAENECPQGAEDSPIINKKIIKLRVTGKDQYKKESRNRRATKDCRKELEEMPGSEWRGRKSDGKCS